MTLTPSTMLDVGTIAPDFNLPQPGSSNQVSRGDFEDQPLLVIFSCNHCPYVIHILKSLTSFCNDMQNRGMAVVMINANDIDNYAADSPQIMIELGSNYGFEFPYLYDESQSVALAYRAACTPDFFLFNPQHELVYRGQYDDSRPGNDSPINGSELGAACEALLAGNSIEIDQIPSMGCNIKWKAGNEPDYF